MRIRLTGNSLILFLFLIPFAVGDSWDKLPAVLWNYPLKILTKERLLFFHKMIKSMNKDLEQIDILFSFKNSVIFTFLSEFFFT